MRHLPIALVLLALPSGNASAQVDSLRKPPSPTQSRPVRDLRSVDTLTAANTSNIEVLRGGQAEDYLGKAVRRQLMDTLTQRRRRWDQMRPYGYAIRVLTVDDCIDVKTHPQGPPAPAPFTHRRLVVHDTTVIAREEAPIPRAYSQRCGHEWRVEDLFRDLARALADTTVNVGSIQYDPAYGFPRYYWTARGFGRPSGVLVESFAPAP